MAGVSRAVAWQGERRCTGKATPSRSRGLLRGASWERAARVIGRRKKKGARTSSSVARPPRAQPDELEGRIIFFFFFVFLCVVCFFGSCVRAAPALSPTSLSSLGRASQPQRRAGAQCRAWRTRRRQGSSRRVGRAARRLARTPVPCGAALCCAALRSAALCCCCPAARPPLVRAPRVRHELLDAQDAKGGGGEAPAQAKGGQGGYQRSRTASRRFLPLARARGRQGCEALGMHMCRRAPMRAARARGCLRGGRASFLSVAATC